MDNCDFNIGKYEQMHFIEKLGVMWKVIKDRECKVLGTKGIGRIAIWDWADLQEKLKVFLTCPGSRGQRKPDSLSLAFCDCTVFCVLYICSIFLVGKY